MADATLFNNDYVKVTKIDDSEYLFSFANESFYALQEESYDLGSYIKTSSVKDDRVEHVIRASSVMTLQQMLSRKYNKLSYLECLQMISTLGTQLDILEKTKNSVFNAINIQNILVIGDTKFLYVSNSNLFSIDEKQNISIDYPVEKMRFDSPEQDRMREVPYKLHKNAWMYSFASIVVFSLTNDSSAYTTKSYENSKRLLQQIDLLPVYYTLLRCLHEDPEKRIFLHI